MKTTGILCLGLLILLGSTAPGCKRDHADIAPNSVLDLPETYDLIPGSTPEAELAQINMRLGSLDVSIAQFQNAVITTKNMGSNQRAEIGHKIAAAEAEKTQLLKRSSQLNDLIEAKQKKDEEDEKTLLAAIEKQKDQERTEADAEAKRLAEEAEKIKRANGGDHPIVDSGTTNPPQGVFSLQTAGKCLEVTGKSPDSAAPLGLGECSNASHQAFAFHAVDDTGLYRIKAQSSALCLRSEGASLTPGAKLVQSPCDAADKAEQFYVLGLNEEDYLLQNLKSQLCFGYQTAGNFVQVACDAQSKSIFRINKLSE